MMSNGLREANTLAHAFAVAGDFAAGDLRHSGALEGLVRKLDGLVVGKAVEAQRPINKIVSIRPRREGVKLRAVTYLAKELNGLLGSKAEDINRAPRRLDQAREQVHQSGLA